MNLIFENLFSIRRVNKKIQLLKLKKQKAKQGVVTTVKIMKEMKDSFYIKDDQSDGSGMSLPRRASIKSFSQSFRKLSIGAQSPKPMRNPSLRTLALTKNLEEENEKAYPYEFGDERKTSSDDMFDFDTINQMDKIKRLKRVGSVKKLKNEKQTSAFNSKKINEYDQVLSDSFTSETSSPGSFSKDHLLSPNTKEESILYSRDTTTSNPTLDRLVGMSNSTSAPNFKRIEKPKSDTDTNEDTSPALFGRMIETTPDIIQIEVSISSPKQDSGTTSPMVEEDKK